MKWTQYINDFISLIFPRLCASCKQSLVNGEHHFCLQCIHQFPYTNFHQHDDNKVAKQFWGRVDIKSATAYLYFKKGSAIQQVMHQLKYQNRPELAQELGKMYAKDLVKCARYQGSDAIVAVPLHKKRLRKRGYNQSEYFARGLAEGLNVKVDNQFLSRIRETETQVNKSRFKRYENMGNTFSVNEKTRYKKVILVDDTITTGATLEACALALQNAGCNEIHIIGIAFTE